MNALTTTFVMALLTVVLVTAGNALGGPEGAVAAFIFAIGVHGVSYWYSDHLILRWYRAREIQPDEAPWLYRMVQELTFQAQMPMPKLYLLPRSAPTVFVTGRNEKHAAVAARQDTQILDEAKLRSALARELSQIKNRDRLAGTAAASAIGAISLLVNIIGK
jgi:heat shock protein HtpX